MSSGFIHCTIAQTGDSGHSFETDCGFYGVTTKEVAIFFANTNSPTLKYSCSRFKVGILFSKSYCSMETNYQKTVKLKGNSTLF
jgi:hypothetical protein